MFNKIKRLVMAFQAENLVIKDKPTETQKINTTAPALSDDLDLQELEFLLKVIGNADLKGHQIEMFYRMVIKLQNQYIQKTKQ